MDEAPSRSLASRGPSRAHDGDWFRRVLGHYPTGVSVITGIADGHPVGLTMGSFTSVSLDPPLIAFLPGVGSSSWPKLRQAGKFCVNILAADQEWVCRAFASRGVDKFAGISWRHSALGAPILEGVVAWIDCELEAVHEAGDHLIALGLVKDLEIERTTLPLLFFQGGYGRFHPHSLAVRDSRYGVQLQLLDRARPLMEATSERIEGQVAAAYCDDTEFVLLASAGTPAQVDAPSAVIGQRLPVIPPLGIWWMAFAEPELVDRWLADLPPDLADRYRQALGQIRELGYCLGLRNVQVELGALMASRPGPHVEPTAEEQESIRRLAPDPLDFVPPAGAGASSRRRSEDIVSLWAPAFTPDGQVALGLALVGLPTDQDPNTHAAELLALSGDVTQLLAG